MYLAEGHWKGPPETVKARYAKGAALPAKILSTTGHEEPCGKQGRPLPKAKHS